VVGQDGSWGDGGLHNLLVVEVVGGDLVVRRRAPRLQ
jgi:hypothetical protein